MQNLSLAPICYAETQGAVSIMASEHARQVQDAAEHAIRARSASKHAAKYALRDAQRAALAELGLLKEHTAKRSNGKIVSNGVVLWVGASRVDGAPIVCVATGLTSDSANSKTGAEIQTFIIRADIAPHLAQAVGADVSVCGNCPFRWFLAGEGARCYVETYNSVLSVFNANARGGYAQVDVGPAGQRARALLVDRHVRAGSYGDPALVPLEVWQSLNVLTGYTHMWRHAWAQPYKAFLMASCDGPADVQLARSMGWRCYYVTTPGAAVDVDNAVECPSSRGVQCADCGLCGGLQRGGAKDVYIPSHEQHAAARRTRSAIPTMETLKHHKLLRVL